MYHSHSVFAAVCLILHDILMHIRNRGGGTPCLQQTQHLATLSIRSYTKQHRTHKTCNFSAKVPGLCATRTCFKGVRRRFCMARVRRRGQNFRPGSQSFRAPSAALFDGVIPKVFVRHACSNSRLQHAPPVEAKAAVTKSLCQFKSFVLSTLYCW